MPMSRAEPDAAALGHDGSSGRPTKFRRTNSVQFQETPTYERGLPSPASPANSRENAPNDGESQAQRVPHTRAVTACNRCRARKSRCDNRRPSCSNCSKFRASCVYESDSSSTCHIIGPQLLSAIGNLTTLLQRQQAEAGSQSCRGQTRDAVASIDPTQSPLPYGALRQSQAFAQSSNDNILGSSVPLNEQGVSRRPPPIQQSLESVLEWRVYSSKMAFPGLLGAKGKDSAPTHQLPCLEYSDLARLELKYIDAVHIKNPVLDLPKLHEMILHVSENGLDWSTKTCLVAMVCAIGAIAGRYKETSQTRDIRSSSGSEFQPSGIAESEPELASRHWNVAAKRLGYAIGQDDIEAVQCLCLAGIWYMCQMQPLKAWKYFSLAGTAWYAATLKKSPSAGPSCGFNRDKLLSLEQSLCFTIYKSDCELRLELDLPGSVLENTDLSQTFPIPPSLDSQLSDSESDITERGWYYYLAEIAARHLINRLLRTLSWTKFSTSSYEVWQLLTEVELFETQLHEWYLSLPPMLKFDIPQGPTVAPHPDELIQILRNRFLTIRELIHRPFVRLCVENSLGALGSDLRSTVAALASKCLQCCLYKLVQVSTQIHQGTWFMMRTHATSAIILNAANIARKDASLLGAASMVMPDGWREGIENMMNQIAPYWDDDSGDIAEIRRAVERALSDAES